MKANITGKRSSLRRAALGMAVGLALIPAFAGAARADEWRDHEVRAHHYWHHPHPEVVEAPRVVYAPPVVVAPPPPPPEGINLILPLHFN